MLVSSLTWVCLPPSGITINIFSWVCWCIWTSRNLLIFENRTLNSDEVVCNALRLTREWQQAQPGRHQSMCNRDINVNRTQNYTSTDLAICIMMWRGDFGTKLQAVVGFFTTHDLKKQYTVLQRSCSWCHH